MAIELITFVMLLPHLSYYYFYGTCNGIIYRLCINSTVYVLFTTFFSLKKER